MNKTFVIFTILIFDVLANNTSVGVNKPVTQHPLHKGWLFHSVIGIFGFILNSLVLLILYLERGSLISSVNVMIMSAFVLLKSHKYFKYY